jgi:hypothetical protein
MSIWRNWKIGALVGLIYGMVGFLTFTMIPDFISSPFSIFFFPLFLPLFLIVWFIGIFFPLGVLNSNFQLVMEFAFPLTGILFGTLIWKIRELFCRKHQNGRYWKKGLFIGFIYGLIAVFWFELLPNLFDNAISLLFLPLTLVSSVINEIFFGGPHDMRWLITTPQFFPLLIISGLLLGGIIGYLICPGKLPKQ